MLGQLVCDLCRCVYVCPWTQLCLELNPLGQKWWTLHSMCIFVDIHVRIVHVYMKYQVMQFCYTEFIMHVLQGHPVASLWPISACSNSSPVLEKPFQTAVAKGSYVCENTHLSPADGRFSGHTVLPGFGHFHSQPSKPLASHHPDDKILFMDWGFCNMSSNTGQYPASPGYLSPFCPQQRHLFVIYLLWHSKDTMHWLFLYFFCCVSHMTRQQSNWDWVNSDRTVDGVVEMGSWPAILFLCLPASTHSWVSRLFAKAVCFPSVWCREMSIVVAIKHSESNATAFLDFLNNSSRSNLTNSGMRLIHPIHSSFRLANIETSNSTHPPWYTDSSINTK